MSATSADAAPTFFCQRCRKAAHTVAFGGEPEHVLCPVCGRTHPVSELHALVPEMRRVLSEQVLQDILRSRRRRHYRVDKSSHGFIVRLELQH